MAEGPRPAARPLRKLVARTMFVAGACALLWIGWKARSLILPCMAGALLAYFCRPAVGFMEQRRAPRVLAIAILVASALAAAAGAVYAIRSAAPSDEVLALLKV